MTRALVAGGAGFLGSHLCERLLREGWEVACVDAMLTGSEANLVDARPHERFSLLRQSVVDEIAIDGPLDWVLHLASPASPVDYARHPVETLTAGSVGTLRLLELARTKGAGLLLASTSEVYGDPLVHPQPETYWGNVNPIGPRSMYDEAKRFAEALTMAFHRSHGVPARIVRIFNTYGPRMRRDDGRAVPTFLHQAVRGEPITVHGDGSQTRSLCFVDDLIEGIWRVVNGDLTGPVNLGNPHEVSMLELAQLVRRIVGSSSEIRFAERPIDDPQLRRPDISLAREAYGWEPLVGLEEGLGLTLQALRRSGEGSYAVAFS